MRARISPWVPSALLLGMLACASPPPTSRAALPEDWAGDTRSQFFVQLADTQFGMFATPLLFAYMGWSWNDDSFARETVNMEKAIAGSNRLKPSFVIVCGDLINTPGHPGQTAEFQRIAGQLDASIPLYVVAGNHDTENQPTAESLAWYRKTFGPDRYSFRQGEVYGIVLNSQLIHSPQNVPDEAREQLEWLRNELAEATDAGASQVLIFQHHPYFLVSPDEDDQYFNIPRQRRAVYLTLFREAGVRAVFSGHYHRNAHGWDGPLEMVTTGPVGKPLGDDPSGLRIVRVGEAGLDHAYFALDELSRWVGRLRDE